MSALLLEADVPLYLGNVGLGPEAEVVQRAISLQHHASPFLYIRQHIPP